MSLPDVGQAIGQPPSVARSAIRDSSRVVQRRGVGPTRQTAASIGFLLPSLIVLALVFLYPSIQTVLMSLQSGPISHPRFVGLRQYEYVITNPAFPEMLRTSLVWTVGNVICVLALGLGGALLLNRPFFGRGIVRTMVILPWAIPYVAASLVWGWMFDYESGLINFLLQIMGISHQKIGFLLSCPSALVSLMGVSVWKLYPIALVVFLAGLQGVSSELYEAAKIDGAASFETLRHITLPALRDHTVMLTLLIGIWSFGRSFAIIFLLTAGGPAGCTETIVVRSYLEAFSSFRFGTASAMGIIVLLISLCMSLAYLAFVYRGDGAHG